MSDSGSGVTMSVLEQIATIEIDHPSRRNALSRDDIRKLADLILEADSSDDVKVIQLQGRGQVFSAGADLGESPNESDSEPGILELVERAVCAIAQNRKVVISAIRGPCVGVAASLVLASDIVVAGESAFFLLPFAGIGLVPDGGATSTVAATLGRSRALRLCLLGERLSATDAFEAGLVAEVCPDDEAIGVAGAWSRRVVERPTSAIAATKALVNRWSMPELGEVLRSEAQAQTELMSSPEFQEALRRFSRS